MNPVPYQSAGISVREDLAAAHRRAWSRIAKPGTWWDGPRRLAIAAETRNAPGCALCRRRKDALSPNAIKGAHDSLGELPDAVVEVVHRIRTDPARLSEGWLKGVLDAGLTVEEYVETVGVVVNVVAIDTFAHGIGIEQIALPDPEGGAPSRKRPASATTSGAWVPWLDVDAMAAEIPEMFQRGRPVANIHRAMSLVPREVEGFFDLVAVQYLPGAAMRDFDREYRAINHAQIELLAARISSLNKCVY